MWYPRFAFPLALLGVVSCVGALPSAPSTMLHKSVHFELTGINDQKVPMPPPGAKATVLEFWSPTCEPCKTRVPALVEREAELRAKGAEVFLVAVLSGDESDRDAEVALEAWGVRAHRSLIDRDQALQSQLGVHALPATAILKGDVVHWIAPAEADAGDVVNAVP